MILFGNDSAEYSKGMKNIFQLGTIHLLWLILLVLAGCGSVESISPRVSDMTISVYAPGRLVDKAAYMLHTPTSGILGSWKVEEGDTVDIDQVLATIESSVSELNLENASIRVAEIQKNLRPGSSFRQDLALAISNAREKYQDDSSIYERQHKLWAQKIGSKRQLELAELAVQNSSRILKSAETNQDLQLDRLQNELKTASNLLKISSNQQEDFVCTSKIRGVMHEKMVEEGEWVSPQQPIGKIGGIGEMVLELEVDEVDIIDIEKGQLVTISLDAYPDKVYAGEVSFVNQQKDAQNQSYKIEAVFKERPDRWFVGMTAEANILIEEKKGVLLVPREYVFDDNKVLTESGDTLSLVIGATDMANCEVLSGLTEQSRIIKPGQ